MPRSVDPDQGFKRQLSALNSDSYFTQKSGHWLPDLYPARVIPMSEKRS